MPANMAGVDGLCNGHRKREMLHFSAEGEEDHEAAGFHRWSDVRGRNGTGAGTADGESVPDRIV
jgi:hypothetical protein